MEHRLCIVGGGPRGTYVLLNMLTAWRTRPLSGRLRIDIVEPVEFGAGAIYHTRQPDFLRLNTIISQVTAYPDDTVLSPLPKLQGPTLYEWYRTGDNGLADDSYPSRRDTGRYLASVFRELVDDAPSSVTIECHRTTAVDMHKTDRNEWHIHLDDGKKLTCHAAVLAVGCAACTQTESAILANTFGIPRSLAEERFVARPYPIEATLARVKSRETIGILGLGLTALDIIRACTVGRGGKFVREGSKLRYLAGGDEPHIVAWSRSGLPLMARAANQKPIDQKVQARFLTEETIDGLRQERLLAAGTTKLDFLEDLLPLLLREMEDAYEAALASEAAVPEHNGCHEHPPATHVNGCNSFNWQQLVSPLPSDALQSEDAFKAFFLDYVRHDIAEAHRGNMSSPVKSACDVIRDLRDKLRYAVEFGGLTPDSHRFFDLEFSALHNRLAVGPPVEAIEELLALIEAGIVDPFCGPAPRLKWDSDKGQLNLHPSAFSGPCRELSVIVNARLLPTDVTTTSTPLVRNMLAGGHIVPYQNALNGTMYRPGGISVTDSYQVIDKDAQAQENLFAIGALTEGCTWYSQVLARPYVNSRSMRDAASVALSLWEYFAGRAKVRTDSPNLNGHRTHLMKETQEVELDSVESTPALT
jgi:uncharacterized NAD(P)/FAD-binding protein YdhS